QFLHAGGAFGAADDRRERLAQGGQIRKGQTSLARRQPRNVRRRQTGGPARHRAARERPHSRQGLMPGRDAGTHGPTGWSRPLAADDYHAVFVVRRVPAEYNLGMNPEIGSRRTWSGIVVTVLLIASLIVAATSRADDAPVPAPAAPQFERDVHPLLKTYCWKCHGGGGYAAELDFRPLPLVLKGGKDGKKLEPGLAQESLLYQKLAAERKSTGR